MICYHKNHTIKILIFNIFTIFNMITPDQEWIDSMPLMSETPSAQSYLKAQQNAQTKTFELLDETNGLGEPITEDELEAILTFGLS